MRFFALILAVLAFAGCADPCSNRTKAEVASPDGRHVATAFIRDCGATAGFSPQVYLRPGGETVGQIGNVFVGDHSDKIEIAWLSSTQLVIYSDCAVVRHETNYHGIRIEKREWR
jgi:hypothetical protein